MTRRILVVDDDAAVGKTVGRALRTMGYEVVTISDPMDAYELLETHRFDLVLIDVNMPGMSGDALFVALVRRAPELAARVLLMSGDPWGAEHRWPADLPRCPMLAKPFGLDVLGRMVADAIND
ncbi:MAG TPA: response regulator, partial [Gemmatimonadales bacterium]|nr:response regulator [Gemmatimonadales bacterium]